MSVLRDYASTVSRPTLPFAAPADPERFDEVVAGDGTLRPAWRSLADRALALTAADLDRVHGEVARFLADDGVTFPGAEGPRPWRLDPVPLIVDAASWAPLEVGLAQRAELLDAVLADLYGPRTLLRDGVIPAAAVFGHAGFIRPVARPGTGDPHPLLLAAADLGRDAEGQWHVIADRVQAPSGLGFAAENRRVISQVLPDLTQDSDLHRIDPFLSALRAALLAAAPEPTADPHIVILSPGTLSETSFDQAFLAAALGFPLVQGGDLIVQGGSVWMKPARWPATAPTERVDVIVRRVDAEWCDPLELRADSRLGVPGLSEAVRRGRVRVVNGLGAGVLENPALLPFLPEVSRRMLGEQLRVPSVPTWWCGDPEQRDSVLTRLAAGDPDLIVRPIDQGRRTVAHLSPAELRARILDSPHRFVGQQRMPLSQAPVWGSGDRARSAPITLRAFTLRFGSAYRPLVGGLATVHAPSEDGPVAKDVWVLKGSDTDVDQGLTEIAALPTARTVPSLAPRALADMFWAGRYAERAEDLLRLLMATQAEFDQPGAATGRRDRAAWVLLGALRSLAGDGETDPEAEFRSLLLDGARSGSAAHSIARLRDALEGVRDQLSGDTWRVFSAVDRAARALHGWGHPHRTAESGGRMLTALLSLYGVTASMIRDSGWHMIEAGRCLERGLQVCRLLEATVAARPRPDRALLEGVLTAAESIVTYRRRYHGSVRTVDALDLLLRDGDNPRSLAFAVTELRGHLAALPASTGSTRAERLLDDLDADVRAVGTDPTAQDDDRPALLGALTDTIERLEALSDAIAALHFQSGPPAVAMTELTLVELTQVHA